MSKTYKLCATALLSALSVALNALTVTVAGNAISFTYIPCFIAAMYLGIIPAATVGFVGDLVAGILFPKGAFNLLISLASTLMGLIPGIVYAVGKKSKRLNLVISLVSVFLVCSIGINSYAVWTFVSGKYATYWVYLAARLPLQLLIAVINGAILAILQETSALDKLFKKSEQ